MPYRIEIAVPLRNDTPLGAIVPAMRSLMGALPLGRWVDGVPPAPKLVDGIWLHTDTGVWFDGKTKDLAILVAGTDDLSDLGAVNAFCKAMEPLSRIGFHYRYTYTSAEGQQQGHDAIFGRTPSDRLVEQRRIRVERAMPVLTGSDPHYNYSLLRETLRSLMGVGEERQDDHDVEHIDLQQLEAEVTGLGAGLS